ncbi:squalene synthase HpnC [Sciscionella sp. SE31]|uniref:squalene synthase HpnC n=1 Tax=Sciscionella sediminilitoris TaxID=1445613 RepID=UPI0009EA9443
MTRLALQRQRPGAAQAHRAPHPAVSTTELRKVAGTENFPVALWFLPKKHRRHLMAIYVYARFVDYIGDEAPGDRATLLRKVSRDLDELFAGSEPRDEVMRVLGETVREVGIPREPLDDLITANLTDQQVREYRTYEQLLDYCSYSANPVGNLVLYVFGDHTPANEKLSDKICTALQILEHLQDIAEDAGNGRIYLPAEDRERFGVSTEELTRAPASRGLRALTAFEAQRAVRLLDEGEPLLGELRGAGRIAVSGFLAGGRATAAAIAAANFDTIGSQVSPSKARTAALALRSLVGGRG